MDDDDNKVFWNNVAQSMTDYNNERHWTSLQLWAVIFFITAIGFLWLAGSQGWIK